MASFLVKKLFFGVSSSGLLICVGDQQLPSPITNSNMLHSNICVLCEHTFKLHLFSHSRMQVTDSDLIVVDLLPLV